MPVGLLFKSAPSRGGFIEDVTISDLALHDVPTALRVTMNWNPAFSRADIPAAERAAAPAHWLNLATPVPPAQGRVQVNGVRIERLKARGANIAFEVDAYAEAPLRDFRFASLDIQARRGGHLQDIRDWRFDAGCRLDLGSPIAVGSGCEPTGLADAHWRLAPTLQRRDVSALPMAEQDIQ